MSESSIISKIEKGKQVGGRLDTDIKGVKYYESAGIQKWGESYRVGIFKIAEENMAQEIFEINEVKEFSTLLEAIEYLKDNSPITFESMNTSKGQKIFDPSIIYSERNSNPYKEIK